MDSWHSSDRHDAQDIMQGAAVKRQMSKRRSDRYCADVQSQAWLTMRGDQLDTYLLDHPEHE